MIINNQELQWLKPNWPAPAHVRAYSTSRQGGFSEQAFNSLNLGDHVGDEVNNVAKNRAALKSKLNLPNEPHWLKQVHGNKVIQIHHGSSGIDEADGCFTKQASNICVVLTADCLPILISDKAGTTVAAIHAGWRGLASGIIDVALCTLGLPYDSLLVWLGPAIGPTQFEVGDDVKAIFANKAYNTDPAFKPKTANKWLLDIYQIARYNLSHYGVEHIYGGGECTFTQSEKYFSYRRDGITGRMASLIWLDVNNNKSEKV
jgi:hypothetical protein